MAVLRLVALALRTRIDGNDMIVVRELVDLLLPDPCRHRPAGDEDDGPAAAGLKVVDPDAVGSFEKTALYCLRSDTRYRQDAEQDHSKSGSHVLILILILIPILILILN